MTSLKTGDLLRFRGALGFHSLYHYGVAVDHGRVLHMWATLDKPKSEASVMIVPTSEFFALARERGYPVEVVRLNNNLPPGRVQQRCMEVEGKKGYHVLYNNCEHVARYCATGQAMSTQLDAVFKKRSSPHPPRRLAPATRSTARP
jgi:hypothetical protein